MAKPKIRNLPDLSHLARPGREIAVKVTPQAAKADMSVVNDTIRLSVTVAPEGGKANDEVRKILARAMAVPQTALKLKRGHAVREKVFVYDPL
ncbi:MAG: DUF167 domain-containing protein [Rhodobacteraceae bacterium]|nr:DUF167 domain-containing protein [Paracoccaceae bacterium]